MCSGVRIPQPDENFEAWTVEYLHEDCKHCEDAAEIAISNAHVRDSTEETWRQCNNSYGFEQITHEATVVRV